MLRPQVTVQYNSKEYREYVRYAEKEYEDRKMIKAYHADPLVARIAQDFASRNHIPNKKESMKKLSVYKIPYPIYSMCSLFLTVVLTFGGVFFMGWFFILGESYHDGFSVWAALYLYFVATFFTLSFFMDRRFKAAAFCVTLLTKKFLGARNVKKQTYSLGE